MAVNRLSVHGHFLATDYGLRSARSPGGRAEHLTLFFFFVDDDARRHHDHEAFRLAAVADVLEQPVDVGNLAQDRRTKFIAALRQALQTAQQHRAAVWYVHGCGRGNRVEDRLLQELRERYRLAYRSAFEDRR